LGGETGLYRVGPGSRRGGVTERDRLLRCPGDAPACSASCCTLCCAPLAAEAHGQRSPPVSATTRRPPVSGREEQPHVAAVIGTPRRHGNTVALVDAALEELARCGCRCSRIMLAELHIGACLAHESCGELTECALDDDMAHVLEKVYAADGLILASPVYYENVSSQMKAFMDRNATRYYHKEWLTPKIVGLIAVATESGLDDTLAAMRRFIALSSPLEVPTLSLGGFADKPGDAAADTRLMAAARELGLAMGQRLGLRPA